MKHLKLSLENNSHTKEKEEFLFFILTMAPDKFIPKTSYEFTEKDEKEVHKDKKAMNILFNGLNKNMFDNVINCTTSIEVWDTLQTLCEGSEQGKA